MAWGLQTLKMVVSYKRDAIFHKIAVSEKLSKKVMKMEAKWSQNGARDARKVDQKTRWKGFFLSIFTVLGLPKGGPKTDLQLPFKVPFRVLGAIWLQKGAVGRSDPIFGACLMILDRFLRKMFNFF